MTKHVAGLERHTFGRGFDSRRLHHIFAELALFRGYSAQTLPNHDGSLQVEELHGLPPDREERPCCKSSGSCISHS